VDLSGLAVVLVLRYHDDEPGSPWTYALFVDDRGDERQREALAGIFTGGLGGTTIEHFPWLWKASHLVGWRAAPIEIEHAPQRGWFRVGDRVTVRVREAVARQEPVTCVIPGHDRPGTEVHTAEIAVDEGPLTFAFEGVCGYESTFAYASA
jgi:hypothetical protein